MSSKLLTLFLVVLSVQARAFDWQGHRGARGLFPENTIVAMTEAVKYPVTTLEIDVVISADGQVIVSHDLWMTPEICRGPRGEVPKLREFNLYKMKASEIALWDCGSTKHPNFPQQKNQLARKPLLRDLLRATFAVRPGVVFNVEIKSSPDEEKRGYQPSVEVFTDKVMAVLKDFPAANFIVQSFDWRVMAYAHPRYPAYRYSVLSGNNETLESAIQALGFTPHVFAPNHERVTRELVKSWQSKGVQVIPWTVNDLPRMKALIGMGVDGIITDYPNLIP